MDFLKSTRFWKLVIIGVLEALVQVGVLDGETSAAIVHVVEFVLGSSVLVRTVDRIGDKLSQVHIQE